MFQNAVLKTLLEHFHSSISLLKSARITRENHQTCLKRRKSRKFVGETAENAKIASFARCDFWRRGESAHHFSKNRGEAAVFGKVVCRLSESNRNHQRAKLAFQPFTKPEGLGEWLECQLCALGISVRRRACLEPFSPFWGQFLRFWTESCPLGNSLKTYVCVAICAVSWLSVCLSVSWVLLVVFHW